MKLNEYGWYVEVRVSDHYDFERRRLLFRGVINPETFSSFKAVMAREYDRRIVAQFYTNGQATNWLDKCDDIYYLSYTGELFKEFPSYETILKNCYHDWTKQDEPI